MLHTKTLEYINMAKTIAASGTYTAPTGQDVVYDFEYLVIDSIQDCVDTLGEPKVKALLQAKLKVDANNVAREKARVENGHSTRPAMTEEDKAQAKAKRQVDKQLLDLLKSKGLSIADLLKM